MLLFAILSRLHGGGIICTIVGVLILLPEILELVSVLTAEGLILREEQRIVGDPILDGLIGAVNLGPLASTYTFRLNPAITELLRMDDKEEKAGVVQE